MKTIAFVAFLTLSLACFAQQPAKSQAVRAHANKSGVRILSVPEGTFECRLKANASKQECKAIPVIVLVRSDGSCLALLPYHDVQVRTTQSEEVVTWKIIGPPDYIFDLDKGIDITSSDSSQPIADVWKSKNRDNPNVFRWKIKQGAPKRSFGHEPNVIAPNGDPCDKADPVIANDAN